MAGMFPNYILREFDNDGRILSDGYIYFYESGTLVPKTVYTDYTLSTPHTNPVQLDGGGAADIWLGDGAYRVLVKSSTGVQIRSPIDGVRGLGSSSGSEATNITNAMLKLYNDVRALTDTVDTIYVSGRSAEGDGGAGWFQRIPGSNLVDDDGIVLTSNSGSDVYKRVFSGYINPEWYGVRYGINTDNSLALQHALTASVVFNIPVRCTGSVYLTQNITVPQYALLQCTIDGFFHSGSTLSFVFTSGSGFDSEGVAFGNNINPVFKSDTVDAIRLSWMGGFIPDDAIIKFNSSYESSSPGCMRMVVDAQLPCTTNFITGSNAVLEFESGCYIDVQAPITINVPNVNIQGMSTVVKYNSLSNFVTLVFGTQPVFPEWFGAKGDGVDDTIAVYAGTRHGRIYGVPGNVYKATATLTCQDLVLEASPVPGGAAKPAFVFDAGFVQGSGRVLTCNGVEFVTTSGTIQSISGNDSEFSVGGVALNGNIGLDSCVFETTAACTIDAQHVWNAKDTVFVDSHYLPVTMEWILSSCVVDASSASISVARADNTMFNTSIIINKLASDTTAVFNSCSFKHSNWKPFFNSTIVTDVDVVGCVFTNTAAQTHAWANSKTWKYPLANPNISARYSGCVHNGKAVWDPYAYSIDGTKVVYVGDASTTPIDFSYWAGLPAGLSASGNNIYANTNIDDTQTPNDGIGFVVPDPSPADHTSMRPNIKATASNSFGYAIVEVTLASSNVEDYVDMATSTSPLLTRTKDAPEGAHFWPGGYNVTTMVRNYDIKHAARCVAGNRIRIPVWIGVENSVTYVDSDGTYPNATDRNSTFKIQLQFVKTKVSTGALITVTMREAVVDDLDIFKALYNEPNKSFDPATYPIYTQTRCVESYSYLGFDPGPGNKKILRVEGNDLSVSVAGGYEINAVPPGSAPDLNLWRCQFVTGQTFYRHWDLEITTPTPMLKHVDSFGQTFSLSKITMAKYGTSIPSASAIAHMNLISY